MSKDIQVIDKFTIATVEVTGYTDTMQLESKIEEIRFDGHVDKEKASVKAKKQLATRDQIAIVKGVKWFTRKYTMTTDAFKLFATVTDEAND